MRRTSYFPIQGGEDLLTPAISIKPGRLTFSKNYECDAQGRPRRIDGFERLDGKPSPSEASYWTFSITTGNGITPVVGDIVEGATSGAQGWIVNISIISGTFAGGNAVVSLIVSGVSGTFQNGETVNVVSDQSTALGANFSSAFSSGFA